MRRVTSDPIELLRDANPVSVAELRLSMRADDHRAELERAIAEGERDGGLAREIDRPRHGPDRDMPRTFGVRAAIGLAAGAAAVAVLAAVVLTSGDSSGPGVHRAFAAEAVEVAEANPRLLIGAPGWSVTRADEFERDQGMMEFGNGEHKLLLDWATRPPGYPAPEFSGPDAYLPELDQWYRVHVGCLGPQGEVDCRMFERNTEISLLGRTAILHEARTIYPEGERNTFIYPERESSAFTVSLPWEGRMDVTIHADPIPRAIPRAKLLEVLDSLYATDIETWLAALPPEVVRPLERPEVVDEMLEGIPIPPSVDVEELKGQPQASSRSVLGSGVTSAVACGWLDQWAEAVKTGDTAAAQEAVEAMSTSRDWPILKQEHPQIGSALTIWEYADAMRRDDRQALLGVAGTETLPDGRVYELRPGYATGLGCDSERRVLREQRVEPPGSRNPIPVSEPY